MERISLTPFLMSKAKIFDLHGHTKGPRGVPCRIKVGPRRTLDTRVDPDRFTMDFWCAGKEQVIYLRGQPIPQERDEDGVLFFMPTVGSMRTAKAWNSMLFSQRLPSGKQAPIFGMRWTLTASLVQNPQQPSKQITKFVKAMRSSIVDKELFTETVQPALATAKESATAITSSTDDAEE